MKISGKYKTECGFIEVCVDNKIYTIAQATGEWAWIEVGDRTAMGPILTQEGYDKIEASCDEYGTFELSQVVVA